MVALLGLASFARADSFASFELAAGGHLPVGDSAWRATTTGSPALFGAVAWHLDDHLGVLASAEALDPLGLVSPSGRTGCRERSSQIVGATHAGVPAAFSTYEIAVLAGIRITSKRD